MIIIMIIEKKGSSQEEIVSNNEAEYFSIADRILTFIIRFATLLVYAVCGGN
jgi:hypothetical protein